MNKYVVKEVTAQRDLIFRSNNGNEVNARVIVGLPVYIEDKDYYQCPYELSVDSIKKRTFAICGVDSLQALALTFKVLDAELEVFEKQYEGEFLFFGEKFHTLLDPEWKKDK